MTVAAVLPRSRLILLLLAADAAAGVLGGVRPLSSSWSWRSRWRRRKGSCCSRSRSDSRLAAVPVQQLVAMEAGGNGIASVAASY